VLAVHQRLPAIWTPTAPQSPLPCLDAQVAKAECPPLLVCSGEEDTLIPFRMSQALVA
jgi:hypothetical protein